jgi:hypothetical protein
VDEHERLACESVDVMLGAASASTTDRKVWLFACACTRLLLRLQESEPDRRCVEVAERFADGLATADDLNAADHDTLWDIRWYRVWPWNSVNRAAYCLLEEPLSCTSFWSRELPALLRCIFGNPFRPISLDPLCLTPTVVGLAQAIYDERLLPSGELDCQRLGILGDALEEAGALADLVEHLREPGPHFPGCWVVDCCTGRS